MKDVFLEHIYVMYFIWFITGVVLLAYIAYRRKRKMGEVKAENSSATP